MTFEKAEKYIHSFTRFGSQLGLKRMKKLLEIIGNPQDKLKFVHVAGTNGKGSTVTMCSCVLQDAGYKTGLYISPFVVDFRERFQINGKMISKTDFAKLVDELKPVVEQMAEQGDQVTEFEIITAIAFKYFCDNNCDIVCLEVGLGGKFDATNVINSPEVVLITSISLDHTEILGNSVTRIASEKAGIIKENTDVVTYPLQNLDAQVVFMERCEQTHSNFIVPNHRHIEITKTDAFGSRFTYNGISYSIRLPGVHQVYNAVSVIAAMNCLRHKNFPLSDKNIVTGLKKAVLPARFEIMSRQPLIIVDGAHNDEAFTSLSETLKSVNRKPLVAIVGMLADKDVNSAMRSISTVCSSIIAIPIPDNKRAISETELAQKASVYCKDVHSLSDYDEALQKAVSLAGTSGGIIVCGSFYMATDMRRSIKKFLKNK